MREETYKMTSIILFVMFLVTAYKYVEVRRAYQKETKNKVWYCKNYHDLKCKSRQDSIMIDELYEENQRFSSIFATIENEEGGHELLEKLWNE